MKIIIKLKIKSYKKKNFFYRFRKINNKKIT